MLTKNEGYFFIIVFLILLVPMLGPVRAEKVSEASSFPSSFIYQGQLEQDGFPVTGSYDFQFKLYDATNAGTQIGNSQLVENVSVCNGVFSVVLDFGSNAFQGNSRWLEVSVRPAGKGDYSKLLPRQQTTPTPYAMHAFSISDGAVTTDKLADSTMEYFEAMMDSKISGSLAVLQASIDTLKTANTDLQGQMVVLESQISELEGKVDTLETANVTLESRVSELEDLFDGVSRVTVGGYDTLCLSGMNLQIINGTGSTNGAPNGVGNLIVGYNEARTGGDNKTGSHYVVTGMLNNYSAYGGIMVGYQNAASGEFASVYNGYQNTASGNYASVYGGESNTASKNYATVSGGYQNTASSSYATVSGGHQNTASGDYATVSGGQQNGASGYFASVSGGQQNVASGYCASVSGGQDNWAVEYCASVSGGYHNRASDYYATVSGGRLNTASGDCASVSGGYQNTANSYCSTVSGGRDNYAGASYASVSGGRDNEALGECSSILGGTNNVVNYDTDYGIFPE